MFLCPFFFLPNAEIFAKHKKIPANVRVMIALVASPTFMVIAYSIYLLFSGKWIEVGFSGLIFSALGVFAYFIVFSGRLPGFSRRSDS
ncbi:MAG: hypothetical protein ACJAZT_001500 [Gammaproteobacteria bacterium]